MWTRWYVEGDERCDPNGGFLRCVAKGIETRTPIRHGIHDALQSLVDQTRQLDTAARAHGYRLVAIGHHPFRGRYRPDPAYNAWELRMRAAHAENAAPEVYMSTYGPDVNLSHPDWSSVKALGLARRLTRHAPTLVAFSLSAPYAAGRWPGQSARVHARAATRPLVRVLLHDQAEGPVVDCDGLVVCRPRIPAEVGRIEFKAFDAVPALQLLGSLAALLAGVCLADPEDLREVRQDHAHITEQLRLTARKGLDHPACAAAASTLLAIASAALAGTSEQNMLKPLQRNVDTGATPAIELLTEVGAGQSEHPAAALVRYPGWRFAG